jgi:hypothetical protein
MVARRVEQVAPVRGVDVEEDSWNHNGLLLEELFEKGLNESTIGNCSAQEVWKGYAPGHYSKAPEVSPD